LEPVTGRDRADGTDAVEGDEVRFAETGDGGTWRSRSAHRP
jgi:hypothetical protein